MLRVRSCGLLTTNWLCSQDVAALLLQALKNESVEDLKELIDFEVVDEAVHQRFKDVSAYPLFHTPCSLLETYRSRETFLEVLEEA